eukprot:SAG31_NODE_17424_length_671_cov_0.798951_1_plen_164_part_10
MRTTLLPARWRTWFRDSSDSGGKSRCDPAAASVRADIFSHRDPGGANGFRYAPNLFEGGLLRKAHTRRRHGRIRLSCGRRRHDLLRRLGASDVFGQNLTLLLRSALCRHCIVACCHRLGSTVIGAICALQRHCSLIAVAARRRLNGSACRSSATAACTSAPRPL